MGAIQTSAAVISREPGDTLVLVFREGIRMDAKNTAEVRAAQIAVANGDKLPTLADVRGIRAATPEARRLAAGADVAQVTSRMALLVGNPVTKVLGNFFLVVSRPLYPTRMFTDEDAARAWLTDPHV